MNFDNNILGMRPTIMVVDDAVDTLSMLGNILKDSYRVKIAKSGEKALEIAGSSDKPDLILLDIMMSGMDGYEVCKRLKSNPHTQDIPIIFLTAKTDISDEEKGLAAGAVDYITKPISPPIVLARTKTHLQLKAAADFLKDKNEYLEQVVNKRTEEISIIQEVMLFALASLAETRDNETGSHIRRTQYYIKALAQKLQGHSDFQPILSDYYIDMLFRSAPLHDIGKVGIPDGILLKPGLYDPTEYEIMKKHTTLGKESIEKAEKKLGFKVEFLQIAKEIAHSHHEWWDGHGYPRQLSGDEIPLSARLMAIADVYDAIISHRVYKKASTHERAVEIIASGRGSQFDPVITDAFLEIQEDFRIIASTFLDGE